ncbi:MAG TPA: hypothetical protein VGG14_14270 [Candidatus Sulfotelmatobacter sp.]
MSARNGFVLLVALSALMFLGACGNNGGQAIGTAPPSGAFSQSSLNGAYVFSASGEDSGGAPYAMAGTLTANGSGGITGGAVDINDLQATPVANTAVNNNSVYTIGADGRGTITIGVANNPLTGNISFDFVLQDSSHGLITGFDDNYSGSGTIDLQSSSPTPTGTYAFSLSGAEVVSSTSLADVATVGNFTVGAGNAIGGLIDLNINGVTGSGYADETVSGGTLTLGPTSTPATTLPTTSSLGTLTFDAIAIDPNHLKFIEMDSGLNLSGDAYSQTAATIPDGNLAFTLSGFTSGGDEVAGGIMMASGGTISASSIEDFNEDGGTQASTFTAPQLFSGTYAPGSADPANSGRNVIDLSGFTGGLTELAAYPSTGGVLLLEIDGTGGLILGAGYTQSSTAFAATEGYGLNLSGQNASAGAEVDDIAEFTAASSGSTITGVIDENSPAVGPNEGITLSGTYVSPDSNGRGQISATAGNSSNSTVNGGFDLTFYTVDGTTFPFIESDADGQTATGVFVEQNPTDSGSAAAKPAGAKAHSLVVTSHVFRPHVLKNHILKSNVR